MNKEGNISFLIIISFATIYIVWGSTYLFSAFALQEMPAFRICGIRYLSASVLTYAIYFFISKKLGSNRKEIINAVIAGFVFLGLGTGGAIWSLNYLDTGLTALIIAGEPLIIVLLMWIFQNIKPAFQTLGGIFLGIAGIYLLIGQAELVNTSDQWLGIMMIFFSMLAWGGGSIFVSQAALPKNQFLNTTIQMATGGLSTLIISFIIQEPAVDYFNLKPLTYWSMLFLIIFGSVAAFTAFNYLLKTVSTEKVVTNTYVNPIIAMILGYFFLDEVITNRSILAAVVMLFGVFIINSNKTKKQEA